MAITQIKGSNIEDGTVLAVDIKDDSITNAKIKSDAAIAMTKLAVDPTDASNISSGTLPAGRYTDTVYTHPTTAGNKHIPTAGATDQVLTYSSSGTAAWADPAAGGEKRNYIIDGDFTQWPEGTSFAPIANNGHSAALWKHNTGGTGAGTITRETDVPTAAESNHQSSYSLKYDVTTLDATPDTGGDHYLLRHFITGTNFKALHQQEVTFSFWHKHTKTGTYTVAFRNGASNRSYVHEYTQSVTDTWERDTHTFTMDTSGTWLFTDADKGMDIIFTISASSSFDAGTADTWLAGNLFSTSNQVNTMDSTSNNMLFSQVSLTLGSDAPTFSSPSIATVKDQVEYYVEKIGSSADNHESFGSGVVYTSGDAYCHGPKYRRKRIIPAVSVEGSNPLLRIFAGTNVQSCTVNAFQSVGYTECRSQITPSTSNLTGGYGCWYGQAGGNAYLLIDARH